MKQEIYFAGGCLWSVQEFLKYLPGVIATQAGRANGHSDQLDGEYDGYAECVKTHFDDQQVSIEQLMHFFFELIDPYSIDKQGWDVGRKYRTGVYSQNEQHLVAAKAFIAKRSDADNIRVEVLPLQRFIASADEHQDRLSRHPEDHVLCPIPWSLLHKYKS